MENMDTRLFEGEEHASLYQKYRLSLPLEMQRLVLSYLEEKKGKPFVLAADVGCGTGQTTCVLAPHFEKVVGTDISEAQIKEAKKMSSPPNVSFLVSPAEELPFEDVSVDLVIASSAAHWFNLEKFMKEANRVLKPHGCMALLTYTQHLEVHAKDCSDNLTAIYREVEDVLVPFGSVNITHVKSGYKDIFDAIPFPDKTRLANKVCPVSLPVSAFIGLIESFSMFQTFLKKDAESAKELLRKTEKRFLEALGASSSEAMVELHMQYLCVLACKPA
ncbi:putative methyltransferase DDB_G0268948 isoform X1 [Pleurodeles waltl]